MRIGILTGGGDVPGLNACIKAVVNRVGDEGHEVVGLRRGWAALLELRPRRRPVGRGRGSSRSTPATCARSTAPAARSCTPRGPTRAACGPAQCPTSSRTASTGERPYDFTDHALRVARRPRHRRADPDRRRRHALVRAAAARRGVPGHRDPEDDGQRRPRHRLLHRLLDRGHPRRAVHPQPPDEHRLARAHRRHRAVRPLLRRDLADHRLPRRASTGR